MIVCGYTFTKTKDNYIRVLNIRPPFHALVMSPDGDVYETSMDDIELSIVLGYWAKTRNIWRKMPMPKYYNFMVYGYYLYFTSHCVVEAMHVHASDRQLYIKWSEMNNEGFYRGK